MKAMKPPGREDVEGGQTWTKLRLSNISEMGGGVGELGREAGSERGGEAKEPGRGQMGKKLCGEHLLDFLTSDKWSWRNGS